MNNKSPIFAGYAPGRVEILGNHTDYNEGFVLGAAIDRGLSVTGTPEAEDFITLRSDVSPEQVRIPLDQLHPRADHAWTNYIVGVAHELRERGVRIGGFTAEVNGNLPAGYGLSSSAALEVATAHFLLRAFAAELGPLEIARACQRAEHVFAGVQSGLLDQVTVLFGKADHLVFFDARTENVETIAFPKGLALIVSQSGDARELRAGVYNERRAETAAAASALGIRALRDISSKELVARADLDLSLARRARHITGENERVLRGIEVLRGGDETEFGRLMFESHESSRVNFENSTPALDLLVHRAQQLPGVLGARLTGAGFGGATITLCRQTAASSVAAELRSALQHRYARAVQTFVCHIADGAH